MINGEAVFVIGYVLYFAAVFLWKPIISKTAKYDFGVTGKFALVTSMLLPAAIFIIMACAASISGEIAKPLRFLMRGAYCWVPVVMLVQIPLLLLVVAIRKNDIGTLRIFFAISVTYVLMNSVTAVCVVHFFKGFIIGTCSGCGLFWPGASILANLGLGPIAYWTTYFIAGLFINRSRSALSG